MRDIRLLNVTFLTDRLRDLQIKQWWLAEQIGVDKKTVARWLNGRVKRIDAENLRRAARLLKCTPEELVLSEPAEAFATRTDLIVAARHIQRESLADALAPSGHWRMLESLIRVVLRPDLPMSILGDLYNQLSIAVWRQSNLRRAEIYARRALEIGEHSGSKSVIAAATLNLATLAAFRGRLKDSLLLYRKCVELGRFLSDEVLQAKAISNYGATCLDAGENAAAILWQRRAIRIFQRLRRPMNEAIAWIGLAQALKESGKLAAGLKACAIADDLCGQVNFHRGIGDAALVRAEIYALRRQTKQATAELKKAVSVYESLHIREPWPEVVSSIVARLEGRFDQAERHIAAGLKLAREFPVDRVRLLAESAELKQAQGNISAAKRTKARRDALLKNLLRAHL